MPMSPEEFAKEMAKIALSNDTESAHSQADKLMCEALKELGYYEGIKIFEEMGKWYA